MMFNHIIKVPASSTNLGAGFDSLGLALNLYLELQVEESTTKGIKINMTGEGSNELKDIRENLIWKVLQNVFIGEKKTVPNIEISVCNQIPLARGLGSSAAAIVGGLGIFEAITGQELTQEKFFRYALALEDHPDNLCAARFGGFTVSCTSEVGQVSFIQLKIGNPIKILLVVPDIQLPTSQSREVLPNNLGIDDTIFNIQHAALTVAAMASGQFQFLRESLSDKLHQPYRSSLVPGLKEVLKLHLENIPGLLGMSLSGAGPSVLCFLDGKSKKIFHQIEGIFNKHGVNCKSFELQIDYFGRTIK